MDSRLNFEDWFNLVGKGTYGSREAARPVFDNLFGEGGIFASGVPLPKTGQNKNGLGGIGSVNIGTPPFNPDNVGVNVPTIDLGLGTAIGDNEGFNGSGNRITLGTGAGPGSGSFPFFSDPNSIVGKIIGPSFEEVQGALRQDGVIPFDDGSFNRPLLDDIIAAIPPVKINPTPDPTPDPTPPSGGGNSEPPLDTGDLPGSGGNGQVPDAPTQPPFSGGGSDDPFDRFNDIFNRIFFPTGGGGFTPPFNPGGGDVSQQPTDDGFFDWLFGGSQGGQGGSASNSNIIQDLIGAVTGGSADNALSNVLGDIGNTAIEFGISDYVADKQLESNKDALDLQRYIYDSNVDRLEPFRQNGLNALPSLNSAANSSPSQRNLFSDRQDINPRTSVTIDGEALPVVDSSLSYNTPTANTVSVNEFNPYNADDPRLQYLIDQGTRAIEGSAAARGKLNSGGTLEALQEMGQQTALGRANEIQALESDRDRLALASDSQRFGQELGAGSFDLGAQSTQFGQDSSLRSQLFGENVTGANFNLAQDQANIANMFNLDDLRFNQNFGANTQALQYDQNQFGKLFENARLGQNSAAQQGAGGASFAALGSDVLQNNGDIRTARTSGFTNALAGLF